MKSLNGLVQTTVTARDADRSNRLTVFLLVDGNLFEPLTEYFRERNLSLSAESLYARSVGLLIDYMAAKGHEFADLSRRGQLFNQFAHDLRFGTVSSGEDPSNLWWLPRRIENVRQIVTAVTTVSDWLVTNQAARPLNPWRLASTAERIVFWRKWNTVKASSMLQHIKLTESAKSRSLLTRQYALPDRNIYFSEDPPPSFLDDKFDTFLLEGFTRPGKKFSPFPWIKYNIRDMMVTLLLHAGGLRVSEPFHLWVNDVFLDPNDPKAAHVRVFHPSDGTVEMQSNVSGKPIIVDRATYLEVHHGRRPLNQEGRRTGWKSNMVCRDGVYMPVFWYPAQYGRLFLKLFRLYLEHERPRSDLPWLFLTEDGLPMTAKAYAEQHRAAIIRHGMVPRKANGTTPHGHRHAYGQRLQNAADRNLISKKTIQVCMHHRSVLSQAVYTGRTSAAVNETLETAALALSGPPVSPVLLEAFS
jgi:hypothetical protein